MDSRTEKEKGGNSKLNVNIKLKKNFQTALNQMCEKYGEEFEKLNGFADQNFNFTSFIDAFIDQQNTADTTIDANANVQSKDITNLINEIPKPYLKLLGYNKVFYEIQKKYGFARAKEWLEAEWTGKIFTHNSADISFRPYCFNYDLEKLATKGMYFIENLKPKPAKHLTTFTDHLLEFLSFTSNRSSGQTGVANALMWMFWFWMNDVEAGFYTRDPEYYRQQAFQKVIYDLNMPYLRVAQTAYTNISIYDRVYCEEMFAGFIYPDGKLFIDYIDEFMEFQKAFLTKFSEMRETDVFTYPVLTYCLVYRDSQFQDEEFARWASKHNMKWADSNFLISPETTSAASCCRLLSDTTKLTGVMNSIGGSSLDIGSVSVITLNLAGIALEAEKDRRKYFDLLIYYTKLAIDVNDVIRDIIRRNVEKGILPNYSYGLVKMERQFSTVGLTGVFEAAKYLGLTCVDNMGNVDYTAEGMNFAIDTLDKINAIKDSYNFDYSINLEQVPKLCGHIAA